MSGREGRPSGSRPIQPPAITTNNPVPAPAQAPAPAPAPAPVPNYHSRTNAKYGRWFTYISLGIVAVGITVLVLRYIINKHGADESSLEFRVDSVSFSPFDFISNSHPPSPSFNFNNNKWNIMNISLVAKNPSSHTSLYYYLANASLFYGGKLISVTAIEDFQQAAAEQTVVCAMFNTTYETICDNGVVAAIDEYVKQGKDLEFNVVLQARVTIYQSSPSPSPSSKQEKLMMVNCGGIRVQFLLDTVNAGGTMITDATATHCQVLLRDQAEIF